MYVSQPDVTLRAAMSYFWIGLGSAIGGVSRYWCSSVVVRLTNEGFPWGTIVVNVAGSLIIGFVATLMPPDSRIVALPHARDFLMIGVLGGYTTFSAFSLQTLSLAREGQWVPAATNVFLSVSLCLIAVWLGHVAASAVAR